MRILHVNKFLYRRGGAEAYMEDLAALQRARGDEVAFFGMSHPDNVFTELDRFFPSLVELDPMPRRLVSRGRAAARMIWSTTAAAGMAKALETFRPDVVHLHNIYHQLSPSVVAPIARSGIAAVMTLHDYKLACPSYRLLAGGEPCTACVTNGLGAAVRRRCKDGSLAASALLATELGLHRRFGAYGGVQAFICPSRFLRDLMARAGVYPERLRHVPHFVDVDAIASRRDAGRATVVYAGRLSAEKGVDTLVRAAGMLPGIDVEIAGEGPERAMLEQLSRRVAPGRVTFLGRVTREVVHDRMRAATVVVLPARWHENQPISILEAFACGVPVVTTTLGGAPELVTPGVEGDLVAPDDVPALAHAIAGLAERPDAARVMGAAARKRAERAHHPSDHLAAIDECYAQAGFGDHDSRASIGAAT